MGATSEIVTELPNMEIDIVPWSEDNEANLIHQMDIGIMPLIDGPWEKGKCGYKLIQYMACSVPVIASPVGINVDIVQKSDSGLLADSVITWQNSLIQLLDSPEDRLKYGLAGRKAVVILYSSEIQAPVMKNILCNALNFKKLIN